MMADSSDVEQALVNVIAAALPAGYVIAGNAVRVYRGQPPAAALNSDLAAGNVINVGVYARPNFARNTTRYLSDQVVTPGVTTLTATVAGNTVTLGGTGGLGQAVGIQVGAVGYTYRLLATDGPSQAAVAMAKRIPHATVLASTVTIPGADPGGGLHGTYLAAVTGADGTTVTGLGNMLQQFCVDTWCSSPADRDAICSFIGPTLMAMPRLALPDGFTGYMRAASESPSDKAENVSLYRRVMIYAVDYELTQTVASPVALFIGANIISVANAPPVPAGAIVTV